MPIEFGGAAVRASGRNSGGAQPGAPKSPEFRNRNGTETMPLSSEATLGRRRWFALTHLNFAFDEQQLPPETSIFVLTRAAGVPSNYPV